MTRQIIRTENAPAPPPAYSQAVKATGLIFVSGTVPTDPATGAFAGETIQEQTRQALRNIAAILEGGRQQHGQDCQRGSRPRRRTRFCGHERGMARVVSSQPSCASGREVAGANPRTQDFNRRHRRSVTQSWRARPSEDCRRSSGTVQPRRATHSLPGNRHSRH